MISSSSRFVVEGVFPESGVVHSFKVVDQNKAIKHDIHLKYFHVSSMLETWVCFHDLSFSAVGGTALSSSIETDSSCRQFLYQVPINAIKIFFSAQCMSIQTGAKLELHLVQGKNSPFWPHTRITTWIFPWKWPATGGIISLHSGWILNFFPELKIYLFWISLRQTNLKQYKLH